MGLLSEIGSMITEHDAGRMASGQGQYQQPDSPDVQRAQTMASKADPSLLGQIFSQAAQQMNPQEYSQHVTPGAGGTNPLGGIGQGGLTAIASALMQHFQGNGITGQLLSRIPGLSTTDPNQMNESQVASLLKYAQQNHPDVFGKAAAQVGSEHPDLLHSFLGKAGLAIGAAALASHFLGKSH